MSLFKKVQKLDVFWRKIVILGIVFILGAPLLFLIVRNSQERTERFNKEKFLTDLDVPVVEQEIKTYFGEFQKTKNELEQALKMLENIATSTTSTLPTN